MMIKFFKQYALSILMCAFVFLPGNTLAKNIFNLKEANNFFDKTNIQLATQNIDEDSFRKAIENVEALQDEAKKCIEQTNSDLLKLEMLQKSIPAPASPDSKAQETEKNKPMPGYISDKKARMIKRHADCKLFIFRTEEAVAAYKKTLNQLSTQQLFLFHKPIWETLASVYNNQDRMQLNWKNALNKMGLTHFNALSKSTVFIFIFCLFIISLYLRSLLRKLSLIHINNPPLTSILLALKPYILQLIFTVGFLFSAFLMTSSPEAVFYEVIYNSLILFVMLTALKWAVISSSVKEDANQLPYKFKICSKLLLYFSWSFITFRLLLDNLTPNLEVINIFSAIGSIIFVSLYATWIHALSKLMILSHTFLRKILMLIPVLLIATVVSTSTLGYYHIAIFTIESAFKSTLCLTFFWWAWGRLSFLYDKFNDKDFEAGRNFKTFLDLDLDKSLIELLLLKLVLQTLLVILLATSFISIWFVTISFMELMEETLHYPIALGGFSVTLLRVLIGTVVFSTILLIGRMTASVAVDSKRYTKNDDTQVVLSSVIVYISFGVALILGLIVVGVDFTGLAIIAGALSVGVGLGLQNIVNNFVSGLILLIEQPIKPGDRVIVGTTEGIVKKIRIRSTQIKTMAKEDVIVPNADLIANQVTNYMFKDSHYRIVCQVGVAYGSDTELVSKLLNMVASNHPDVLNNNNNAPKVLFRQFGDSSLIFELWSTIKEVNNKYIVQSELNFAIDKLFRENNVVIAFPQMDLHIKKPDAEE